MHFSDKTPMTKTDLEKELKKFLPKYDSNKNKRFDIQTLLTKGNEEKAIKRAERLRGNNLNEHKDWMCRPSTNFDELIKAMKQRILER